MRKRFIVTTLSECYLNDFDSYDEAYDYCMDLDISTKLIDNVTHKVDVFTNIE